MKSLHDLADSIGYEAIDREFMVWLDTDKNLREEAVSVIRQHEPELFADNLMLRMAGFAHDHRQEWHRFVHPDGPWGWEYCGERSCKL